MRAVGGWNAEATAVSGGGRGNAGGNASGGGGRAGGGIRLGAPAEELTITQDDTMLVLKGRMRETEAIIDYHFNGRKVKNLLPIGRGQLTVATYASRWSDRKLTSTVARELNVRGSVTVTQYRKVMYLTPEGLLALETTVSGNPAGRRAVYRRIDP